MASASKKNIKVSEKVQEIKRMQRNWFDQRASSGGSEKTSSSASRLAPTGRGSSKGAKETTNKPDTVSWVVSGNSKKKPVTVRARSASPARPISHKSVLPAQTSSRGKGGLNPKVKDGRPQSSGQPTGHLTTSRSDTGTVKKSPNLGGSGERYLNGTVSHVASEPNLDFAVEPNENWNTDSNVRTYHPGATQGKSDQSNHSQQKGYNHSDYVTDIAVQSHSTKLLGGQSDIIVQTINQSSENEIPGVVQSKGNSAGLMEPDAFDKLADHIASKVKADLKLERNQVMHSIGYSGISILEDDGSEEGRSSVQSGHKCSKCKQFMVAPDHTPIILIPCGHTLCEACAEDRIKCPTCRTRVTSTTINSTLQQVISAGAVNSQLASIKSKGELTSHQSYTPLNKSDLPVGSVSQNTNRLYQSEHRGVQVHSSHLRNEVDNESRTGGFVDHRETEVENTGRRKISPEEQAQKYLTEYQNLLIRCEAMEGEEEEILAAMERKNREIAKQKKQVWNISNEQDRLREESRKIEERINALDLHRREYEQQCKDLEEDKTEQSERLTLVRDMLRGLERNKEKVHNLVHLRLEQPRIFVRIIATLLLF
ncbi:uncharacterized protein [Asterias amurensis]|uniref:uncharacterized protein isoform X1 n=1 Tax=Asterias amurensis TaxID=7602 RepID=UPI003AB2ED90